MRPAIGLLRALPARLLRPTLVGAVVIGVLAPSVAAHADPSISQIEQQIKTSSSKLEKIVEQYNGANEELKSLQASVAAAQAKAKMLQTKLDAASQQVGMISATAYKGGDMVTVTALLSSGSPAVLVDRLTSLDKIAEYEQQQIADFAQAKAAHDAQLAHLARLTAAQQAKKDELTAKRTQIKKDLAKLYALRKKVYSQIQARAAAAASTNQTAATPPYVAGKAGIAVRYVYGALGKPYAWGAAGPNSYDCSGLTMAAWAAAGVSLPHQAAMQWNALPHISRSSLRPGDLVFYENLGHVAMYIGNNQVIHAPTFGEVVKISSIDMMPPYGYARVS